MTHEHWSIRRARILAILSETPDMRTPEIAKRLGVGWHTTNKDLRRLRAEGLVRSRRVEYMMLAWSLR